MEPVRLPQASRQSHVEVVANPLQGPPPPRGGRRSYRCRLPCSARATLVNASTRYLSFLTDIAGSDASVASLAIRLFKPPEHRNAICRSHYPPTAFRESVRALLAPGLAWNSSV